METDREEKYKIQHHRDSVTIFDVIETDTNRMMNKRPLTIDDAKTMKVKLERGEWQDPEEPEPEETPEEEQEEADQEEKFTDENYLQMQTQLSTMAMLASLLDPADISKFINAINHAETIGLIVDPTKYRKAMHNLDFLKEIAEATLRFNKTVRTIQARTYGKAGKDLIDHQEEEDGAEKL